MEDFIKLANIKYAWGTSRDNSLCVKPKYSTGFII